MTHINGTKQQLRRDILRQIKNMPEAQRLQEEEYLQLKLLSLLQGYNTVALYHPMMLEVNIWPIVPLLVSKNITVVLPRCHYTTRSMTFHTYSTPDDLGGFSLGVRVPTTDQYKAEIDCMAVPLIAIDQHYNRLGRGRWVLRCISPQSWYVEHHWPWIFLPICESRPP